MDYLWLKAAHVLSVVLFLGNIITGLFWKAHADRSGDPRLIAHALRGIIASDRWFTIPGVVLIVVTGILAAVVAGIPLLRTGWLLWPIVLFTLSGVIFGVWVAPLQARMLAVALAAEQRGGLDSTSYRRLSRRWELWGALSLLLPLAVAVIMVLKPALPAL